MFLNVRKLSSPANQVSKRFEFSYSKYFSKVEISLKRDNRDYSLDFIRIIACLMVVLMHSPSPNPNPSGLFYGGISYLTSPCIGLFFMVSGANLLPSKQSMSEFLKKRLNKILWPTILWSIIYILIKSLLFSDKILLENLLSIPFSPQGHGVLWFMYTLVGLYILTPIISPWLIKASSKEILFILGLWFITLLYPLFKDFLIVRDDLTGTLYYFSGYAGYYILGYFLKNRKIKINNIIIIILYLICIISFVTKKSYNIEKLNDDLFWYLGIFTVLMTFCIFQYLGINVSKKINNLIDLNPCLKSLILSISTLSFGIYLIHIAIMRYFLWNQKWFLSISNCIIETLVCFILTFIISYIFCFIISKTPFSKYLIGV